MSETAREVVDTVIVESWCDDGYTVRVVPGAISHLVWSEDGPARAVHFKGRAALFEYLVERLGPKTAGPEV